MAGGDLGNRRHQTAELERRIVELRDQDLSFREIAAEVGLSLEPVWRHYKNAMNRIPAPAAEAHQARIEARREAQLRRIDMQREVHEAIILAAHKTVTVSGKILDVDDFGPVFAATDRLVKLDAEESDLLGLKTETKVSHTGNLTVTYELPGIDMTKLV